MDRGARRNFLRGARAGPRRHAVQGEELHLRADRQQDRLRPGQARHDHRSQGNARSRQAAADDRRRQRRPATDQRGARPLLQPRKLRHLAGRERADGRLRQHLPELHAVQPAGIRGLVPPPLGLRRARGGGAISRVRRGARAGAKESPTGGGWSCTSASWRSPATWRSWTRASSSCRPRSTTPTRRRSWAATTISSGRSSAGRPTSTTFPATSQGTPEAVRLWECGIRARRGQRQPRVRGIRDHGRSPDAVSALRAEVPVTRKREVLVEPFVPAARGAGQLRHRDQRERKFRARVGARDRRPA